MKVKNIKLVTYLQRQGEEMIKNEVSFKSLRKLKQYVKDCGGIKNLRGAMKK